MITSVHSHSISLALIVSTYPRQSFLYGGEDVDKHIRLQSRDELHVVLSQHLQHPVIRLA